MPRAFRTDQTKYESVVREARISYFKELLAPYIQDGFLDTKALKLKNPRLYEEFRMGFKGIRAGCTALNIPPSQAAMRTKVGPIRKQMKTLAVAFIEENGAEMAADKLGTSVGHVNELFAELQKPPKARTYKRKPGRPAKKK